MAEDNFDPSQSAALRLYSHILQKGFQAGSIIGVGIVAPILAYRQGSLDLALLTRAAGRGALWGTAATGQLRCSGRSGQPLLVLSKLSCPLQRQIATNCAPSHMLQAYCSRIGVLCAM